MITSVNVSTFCLENLLPAFNVYYKLLPVVKKNKLLHVVVSQTDNDITISMVRNSGWMIEIDVLQSSIDNGSVWMLSMWDLFSSWFHDDDTR